MVVMLYYLVTGANRGIGRALVTELLNRPAVTVVATVRDPGHETAESLKEIPTGAGSRILILPWNASESNGQQESLEQRLEDMGVSHLDVVISNAATSSAFRSVLDTSIEHVRDDYETNAIGTLKLFQACWPFLKAAPAGHSPSRKFVLIASSVASIGGEDLKFFPITTYGMSKAAANWLAKKISIELQDEGLKVGIIHPGWVRTNMGQGLADTIGIKEPPTMLLDSSKQVLKRVKNM